MWTPCGRCIDAVATVAMLLLALVLTLCRQSSSQTLMLGPGMTPVDSQGIQTLYERHKAAQVDVDGRLGTDPDLRKLVCASTSLTGFASKNSSVHLTPTLKTRSALSGFKNVGVPIYDSCQVRSCKSQSYDDLSEQALPIVTLCIRCQHVGVVKQPTDILIPFECEMSVCMFACTFPLGMKP